MVLVTCSVCSIPVEKARLVNHVVSLHRLEANFMVHCTYCGASYDKWRSFLSHLRRKHKDEQRDVQEEIGGQDNDHPPSPMDVNEGDENTAEHDQDPEMTVQDLTEWQAVTFFGTLQEEKMLPKKTAEEIVHDVNGIIRQKIEHLQAAVSKGLEQGQTSIAVEHINEVFQKALESSTFRVVNSTYLHEKYLKKHCNLVMPERKVIGTVRSWSHTGRIVQTEAVAYIVPFLEDLELLLNNRDVLDCVENPRQHKPGVYASLLDGSSYRDHAIFRRNPKALSIILYYDDVEFCNPIGSKTRKLGMFYYILGNIHPELRSSLRVVNLLAIVDSRNLKAFGVEKVLEPFINDMKKLSGGVELATHNNIRYFSGFLQCVVGDTPASNLLAGFKEGVGSAQRPCRTCLVTKEQLREVSSEGQVVLRDKTTHEHHIARVTDPRLRPGNRKMWSTLYGVNGKCSLSELEGFDVTKGLPQDFMHVVIEGTLEAQCRNFISHCVEMESPLFTLCELNTALSSFKYGHLVRDKPSPIERQHLQNGLKQSAAQLMTLGFILPFVVYQWLDGSVSDHLHNLIALGQIVNLSLAFQLTSQEVILLKKMIQVYIISYLHIYPDATATPKLHYMIHLPEQIKRFGPLRQHWCMRFEAQHQYFKKLASKVKNFRNLLKTFSERKQKLKCINLATPSNDGSKTFLYHGDVIKAGKLFNVRNHPYTNIMVDHDIPVGGRVMSSPSATVQGTTYKKGSVLLLTDPEDDLPQYGLVQEILVYERMIFLRYVQLKTKCYEDKLNAYLVVQVKPEVNGLTRVSDLIHPHALSLFKCVGKTFVILMYYKRSEFIG